VRALVLVALVSLGATALADEDDDATYESIARARDLGDDEGDVLITACKATPDSAGCLELRGRCDGVAPRAGGQLLRMCDALGWTHPAHDTIDLDALARSIAGCKGRADDPFCARLAHACFLGTKYGYYAEDDLEAYCKFGAPETVSTPEVRALMVTLGERAGVAPTRERRRVGPLDVIGGPRYLNTLVGTPMHGWGLEVRFRALFGEIDRVAWTVGADVELAGFRKVHALGLARGGVGTYGKWVSAAVTAGVGVGGVVENGVEFPIGVEFTFGHKHRVLVGGEVGPRLSQGTRHIDAAAHAYWLIAKPSNVAIYVGAEGQTQDGVTFGALVAGLGYSR
jgi:hypothetical protein